jgi:hypothetical protein
MTSATISLDKKTYPMMMHLSILPQYNISNQRPEYDPATQSSTFNTAMAGSWCTENGSTPKIFGTSDSDSKEDD